MPITLAAIHIHPVKSCAPLALDAARVERRGLAHDRRYVVVDAQGRFLTGRQLPRLTLLRALPVAGGLALDAPGMPSITLAAPEGNPERISATIWDDGVDAAACEAAVDAWLTRFLGQPVRLAYMDRLAQRAVSLDYGRIGDEVGFADGYPLLLLSRAAQDALNARLSTPLPISRFRPNLVVEGCDAHAEDGWRRIRVGAVEFDLVKPCTRCVFTTVDGKRGAYAEDGEPLATLKGYRRGPRGITFGQNLIARGLGTVHVGDAIEVLA
jgi:uncharacterized protein YcbX